MNKIKGPKKLLRYLLILTLVFILPHSGLAREIPQGADKVTIKLTFMGDCVIGGEEKSRKRENSFDSTVAEKGYDWPFSGVQHLLSNDDLSIINFEGVLQDDTRNRIDGRLHWFRGPTDLAHVLAEGNIELAGLANNHAKDYGNQGLNNTRLTLNQSGIDTFGYEQVLTRDIKGIRLGFGGIRETTWRHNRELPSQEIEKLQDAGCDYIIYTIHAGKEYSNSQNELQQEMARSIIDAGADLIIGTHPHVVQGIEHYQDGLILYSLGNFVFGGNLKLTRFEGLIAQVELTFDQGSHQHTALNLHPVVTSGSRPDNDFRPIPATGEDKLAIFELVQAASDGFQVKARMEFPGNHVKQTEKAESFLVEDEET